MTDDRKTSDPLTTSSFETPAVGGDEGGPEAVARADATGDARGETSAGFSESELGSGGYPVIGEEAALVTAALQRELDEAKDKYLRLYAEFENFRRRTVKERQDAEHRGMQNLLRGLLETLDDLSRVAHVDPKGTDTVRVLEGVALVEKKLFKSLAGHGLEVVDPKGQPFDPALHEAISTAPAASEEEDHLVGQVFQVGYVFNGTLLRPARVVVMQWNG
jgi:molecular chaperone GrpE